MIVSDIAYPLFSEIASAAEEEASSLGYNLVTLNSRNIAAKEISLLSRIDDAQVDGILLMTNHPDDGALLQKINTSRKIVLLDEDVPGAIAPRLFADNRQGGRLATDHLISNGHQDIGFVGGPIGLLTGKERLGGFLDSLKDHGRNIDPKMVVTGRYAEQTGTQAIRHFASLKKPPTAIFASADMLALGVLRGCRMLDIHVPDDVSLVSFDDIRNVDLLDPPLTTVRQSAKEFGTRGVRLLIDHINGAPVPETAQVPVELIVRRSVMKPKPRDLMRGREIARHLLPEAEDSNAGPLAFPLSQSG